jgi:hypothetical protein
MGKKYRLSPKSEAIGELCYLAKYGKMKRGKSCCESRVSNLKCWNFLPRTSRYGATLFTLSIVKSYGDVATLTRQFTSPYGFPGFIQYLCLLHYSSPLLRKHPPFRCHVILTAVFVVYLSHSRQIPG